MEYSELEEPQSRNEKILKNIIDSKGVTGLEEPQSRIEKLLYYIAEHSGGGSGAFIKVGEVSNQSQLPSAYTGSKGDYFLDTTTSNWWVWNGTTFYEKVPDGKPHIHTQSTLSTTWNIQHNLGSKYPNIIAVIDDSGNIQEGFPDYDNSTNNLLVISFINPIKGKAIVK